MTPTWQALAQAIQQAELGQRDQADHLAQAAIDIFATESCPASYVRLRHYEVTYAADGDTRQPRLQKVRVFGRDDTPEANARLEIDRQLDAAESAAGG